MSDDGQETVDEIADELHRFGLSAYAERLRSAWKRERTEIEQSALSVGAVVEASRREREAVTVRNQFGNAAEMREALTRLRDVALVSLERRREGVDTVNLAETVVHHCVSALSTPARNCDVYVHDEALEVWAAENENERNGCFDEWLYHVAAERKRQEQALLDQIRDALVKLNNLLSVGVGGYVHGQYENTDEIERTIKDDLAAPPRNCDRFNTGNPTADLVSAIKHFASETGTTVFNLNPGFNSAGDFALWLMSATKEKGNDT